MEIDVPDGLIDEMDRLLRGVYHSREEYILDKIRDGIMQDEKNTWFKDMAKNREIKMLEARSLKIGFSVALIIAGIYDLYLNKSYSFTGLILILSGFF
ncbi:hypothetical protein [Acidiplasma cupricumulans]|uniref:hypothetical protein n=1 Tax=Acidiplasma cupricumulans TaxID=312540 RepID=UPI0015858B9A|nr:hypothetical protein [Acidiplasma cupricumulans]